MHGCIYDPYHNEIFTAWTGKGAYLNGNQITCCSTEAMEQAVVCTGSPPNIDALNGCLRVTEILSKKVRTVRMIGSAALMTAWIACGRVTAYVETDLNIWDSAAGALLIQEAGGRVTDAWGHDYTLKTRNFVGSNGRIHDALLHTVKQARMWMPSDDKILLLS